MRVMQFCVPDDVGCHLFQVFILQVRMPWDGNRKQGNKKPALIMIS